MQKPLFEVSKTKGSERGELIQFFVDNLKDKNGEKYPIKRIAIALSHLKLPDLYYMVSLGKDILRRNDDVAFNKWFWGSLKVKK